MPFILCHEEHGVCAVYANREEGYLSADDFIENYIAEYASNADEVAALKTGWTFVSVPFGAVVTEFQPEPVDGYNDDATSPSDDSDDYADSDDDVVSEH